MKTALVLHILLPALQLARGRESKSTHDLHRAACFGESACVEIDDGDDFYRGIKVNGWLAAYEKPDRGYSMSHSDGAATEAHGDWLWLSVVPLGLFAFLSWGLITIPLPWQLHIEWIPSLDIGFDWTIDALSAQFLVLVTGIGAMVFIYASGYLAHTQNAGRFFGVMLLFMAAMVGAVSADHMLVLFVCWELTSLTSFFLVGFNHTSEQARASARQALFITLGGGLALLAGFILLSQIYGTWSLQTIVTTSPERLEDPRLPAALTLVFIGCFTKSAQFPFHFWLPNAMSAPTPASAYLHSAIMVKLGIYLLARLDPAFNNLVLWEVTLIGVGTITAVWAAMLALRERDLKRILARSTVSALGTLVLLIGLPNQQASVAVVAFLYAHALYKAPLFFVAGNIDHATGTRSIDHLMGLRRNMPFTALAAVLAGLSMAGLPLSFGYLAKGIVSAAKSETDLLVIVSYGLLFVNAVAVAVAAVAAIRVFWGRANPMFEKVREVSWRMLVPPLLIAANALEFEFFPTVADPLLVDAARVMAPGSEIDKLVADHPSETMLTATELTLFVGLLLFIFWERLHRALSGMARLDRFGPDDQGRDEYGDYGCDQSNQCGVKPVESGFGLNDAFLDQTMGNQEENGDEGHLVDGKGQHVHCRDRSVNSGQHTGDQGDRRA